MKRIFFLLLSVSVLFSCKKEEKSKENTVAIEINKEPKVELSSGSLHRIDAFPSQFIKARPVDIWLPDGYSADKKYAVLYMHDGQMLFDAKTTWNKQEWKVDEWAGKLQKEGKTKDFIVVAPHNISEIRWNDYFPQGSLAYLPKATYDSIIKAQKIDNDKKKLNANNYLKFLTKELKPFIDKKYSVYADPQNTMVAGSSMGGLISMYAVTEYPEVFSKAACISTHWPGIMPQKNNPIPQAIFAYMKDRIPLAEVHSFYFDYGTKTLDQYYPQYASTVDSIFKYKGYDSSNFVNRKFEGADHSENSWNLRLDIPLTFLFGL